MKLSGNEEQIAERAIKFAKENRTQIARNLTDKLQFPTEKEPVSVFMAGSPGAGKTEASKLFLDEIGANNVVRLDPDDLRHYFEEYRGTNSYLFQSAVSFIVERTLDFAFKNDQSFLLDGTLSNYGVAHRNIERSLRKNRQVLILFVYQKPEFAWEFVQAREKEEGRRIEPAVFVDQFLGAQAVVNELKGEFGSRIQVDLLVKNNKGHTRFYHGNVDEIERYITERYTRKQLLELIK
ncbi:zeta toxin family protein [Idiomarina sp.]|jgi:predicted ABC-type ATPase|uniref:zeta toxin family protein n=1 Tax=Idiomarina sp. TaxID=1874361 RepID=UPI001DCC3B87|nr:zeta toxin family protein [Idiomarina sp.]MCJ8317974.1 zeta toxin family protein [Idiomarina sp.]NQZ17626.1 zeta toxin family protein [Idiomarina sp.]